MVDSREGRGHQVEGPRRATVAGCVRAGARGTRFCVHAHRNTTWTELTKSTSRPRVCIGKTALLLPTYPCTYRRRQETLRYGPAQAAWRGQYRGTLLAAALAWAKAGFRAQERPLLCTGLAPGVHKNGRPRAAAGSARTPDPMGACFRGSGESADSCCWKSADSCFSVSAQPGRARQRTVWDWIERTRGGLAA
jgi:hypothetical protein